MRKVATILFAAAVVVAAYGAHAQPAEPDDPEQPRGYGARRSPAPGLRADAGGVVEAPVGKGEAEAGDTGEGWIADAGDFFDEVSNTVLGWQKQLTQHMPEVVAWIVVAAPLWFVILLALIRRARRPKHRSVARSKKKKKDADRKTEAERRAKKSEAKASDKPRGKRRERRKSKVQDVPVEVFKPTPVQQLLLAQDGRRPSLLETFCVLGADMDAIVGLRRAAKEELDDSMWVSSVSFKDLESLRPFRKRWVKETAALRLQRWLSEHPFVTRDNLHVTMPGRLQLGELEGMTLTEPSGLGVELEADQWQLIDKARQMLRQVCKEAENPYVVLVVAREAEVPELMGCNEEDLESLRPYRQALLLQGLPALEHGVQARLSSQEGAKGLREALEEHHKLVDTPVPSEGAAAHALHMSGGSRLSGIGTLLAAVAGAAYSANAVVMKISKAAADVPGSASHDALVNLGELVAQALADPRSAENVRIADNLKRLVGVMALKRAVKLAGEVQKGTEKLASKQALWEEDTTLPPDRALAELFAVRVGQLSSISGAAVDRMNEILTKLAYAGQDNANQQIACRRLGFTCAGLGAEALSGTGTELLSAWREAASELRQASL